MIGDGKPLRHVFRFKNNSGRMIRITGSIRSSTCCTSFGDLPGEVEPGDLLEVPVELKTVGKSGNLRGEFAVGSDSPRMPTLAMELRANLLDPFEVRDLGHDFRIALGRPESREFEVILRTRPGEAVFWPTVSGLTARLDDEQKGPGQVDERIIESRRTLAIAFGAEKAGRFSEALHFRWADGREKGYRVAWEVVPPLRAVPQTLVLDPAAGLVPSTIMVASDDAPFQILSVAGESVHSFRVVPGGDRRTRLELQLDPAHPRRASKIRITTDHPKVAEIGIDVLIPRLRAEGHRP